MISDCNGEEIVEIGEQKPKMLQKYVAQFFGGYTVVRFVVAVLSTGNVTDGCD